MLCVNEADEKKSKFLAFLSILAAIVTIFAFFSGKRDIFDLFTSGTTERDKSVISKPDGNDLLNKKLKEYGVQRVLFYTPKISIKKHIEKTVGDKSRQRVDSLISYIENTSSTIQGESIEQIFINSDSEYIRNIKLIEIDQTFIDLKKAIEKAKEFSSDAILSIKLGSSGLSVLSNKCL